MCKTTSSTNESTNQFHWIPFPKHYLQPSGPILVWDSTKENIGLVVVLPRTYPLLVTNTLSHCCQLQRFRSRASHPVARSSPARKQRKRLGWWWHYPLLDMGFHCPNPLHAAKWPRSSSSPYYGILLPIPLPKPSPCSQEAYQKVE